MRFSIHQIKEGEDELILNYKEMNKEIEEILAFMERRDKKLIGKIDGETIIFSPEEVLYIEKVDDKTFVYTIDKVIMIDLSLAMVEIAINDERFFRCSKSMILNIEQVKKLKSLPSNRIDATLQNGEHIIISRTYASEFRKILREGK